MVFVVICNGPSLAGFDFNRLRGLTSIGMNAAYRQFERIDFWPTYFMGIDLRVAPYHADKYVEMIQSPEVGCSAYFLSQPTAGNVRKETGKLSGKVVAVEETRMNDQVGLYQGLFRASIIGCTGACASQLGIQMGFKRIVLLGADCNYVEMLPESKQEEQGSGIKGIRLTMSDTPKENPNYWFGDYQKSGDQYHVPNAATTHMRAWKNLKKYADEKGVGIINCSESTKVPYFPVIPFEEAIWGT